MKTDQRTSWYLVGVLLAGVLISQPAQGQIYPSVPPILQTEVDSLVADLLDDPDTKNPGKIDDATDKVLQIWSSLFFYALADAVAREAGSSIIQDLPAYRYYGELARTDKQIGAPPGGPGSTTLVEKPGLPNLFAFAIENGAIEQKINGTTVTLSTSPYAFVKYRHPDTGENYDRFRDYRKVAASVSITVDEDNPQLSLTNFSSQRISGFSVRVQPLGDRSTRSEMFTRLWKETVEEKIEGRLEALNAAMGPFLDEPTVDDYSDEVKGALKDEIAQYLKDNLATPPEEKQRAIVEKMLEALHDRVFVAVRDDSLAINPDLRRRLVEELAPRFKRASEKAHTLQEDVQGIIERVNRSQLLTLAYTNERPLAGSVISDVKLLYENYVEAIKLNVVLNAGISLYHDPVDSLQQSTVRDYSAALSLEAEFDSPFATAGPAGDFSKITFSLNGRLSRNEEIEDQIGILQVKLDIPVANGLSLPLSFTYATRTEPDILLGAGVTDEAEWRGNFGFTIDFDKLFALRQIR